jgi:transposase
MKKVLSKKELADMYGVHSATLTKWLKEIKALDLRKHQKIFTPLQLEIIFRELGEP